MAVLSFKRLIIACVVAAAVVLTGVSVWQWFRRDDGPLSEPAGGEPVEVTAAELSAPTDYWAPAIDEIRREHADPAEQYALLLHYGYLKEEVARYDEAVGFYEAAAEVAPGDEQRRRVWHRLYVRGVQWDRPELTDKYRDLLGQDWIDDYEETAAQRRGEHGQ